MSSKCTLSQESPTSGPSWAPQILLDTSGCPEHRSTDPHTRAKELNYEGSVLPTHQCSVAIFLSLDVPSPPCHPPQYQPGVDLAVAICPVLLTMKEQWKGYWIY